MEPTRDRETNHAPPEQGPLAFFMIYVLTGVGLWVAWQGGIYTLVAPLAVTFVAVPILDVVIGVDTRNPRDSSTSRLKATLFRFATWLALPLQAFVLLWGAAVVTRSSVSVVELAGAIVAVGMTGGAIGITVAHELVHRASRVERVLGNALLVLVCYLHWATEHVAGHHKRVATPEDAATARLGESLPSFLLRSTGRGFLSSWRIEQARNARRGRRSPLRNPVLWGVVASCSVGVGLGLVFGPRAVWFFFAQSVVAVAFLETVNYIEHYGLERRQLRPGVYERVTPIHSWNASQWLTNVLLFNLQRHSDHHAWPARPYYKLRHRPDAPQLPTGYAGMALLAMVPPLWRRVMDPRVAAHRARLAASADPDAA